MAYCVLDFGDTNPVAADCLIIEGRKFVFYGSKEEKARRKGWLGKDERHVRIQGIGLEQTTKNLKESLEKEGIKSEILKDGLIKIESEEVIKYFTEGSSSITHG